MVVQLPRPHSPSSFFRLRSSPVSAGFVSQNAQLGKGPDPSSFFRPHSGLVCTAGAARFRFVRVRRWFSAQAAFGQFFFSTTQLACIGRFRFAKRPARQRSGSEFVFSTAIRHCLHRRSGEVSFRKRETVVQRPSPHSASSFFRVRSSPASPGFVWQKAQLGVLRIRVRFFDRIPALFTPPERSSQGSATDCIQVPILERRLANQKTPNRRVRRSLAEWELSVMGRSHTPSMSPPGG